MSIQIIDKTIFLAVARKMFEAKSAVSASENYYQCCKLLSDDKIRELVTSWHDLNYDSYMSESNEAQNIPPSTELVILVTPPPPKAIQFLKWLQCIRNNIYTQQVLKTNRRAAEDVLFLDRLIREVCIAIIIQLPEYEAATWSTYK